MLKKSHLGDWLDATVLAFFEDAARLVDNAVKGMTPVPATLTTAKAAYEAAVGNVGLLFKTGASAHSKKLLEWDAKRDGYLTGAALLIEAHTYNPDSEVRAAASLLEGSLKAYGSRIAKRPFADETAIINSLLRDWNEKPALSGAVPAIAGLSAFITALTTANSEFNMLYLKRTAEAAQEPDFTTEEAQAAAIATYEGLLAKIKGFGEVSENPVPWKALLAELSALWDKYEANQAIREGHAAAAKASTKPA